MVLDSKELAVLYRQEKDVRRKERLHALYFLAIGYSVGETASAFLRDEDTIRSWLSAWEEKRSIDDESRSGRPPELEKKWVRKIVKLADEDNPRKHGINVAHWDCKELCSWLSRRNLFVSQETVRQILVANGFRYVKTSYELARANKKEQHSFVAGFKRFLRGLTPKTVFCFMDEMSAKLHPKQGYIWTRKKKPVVRTHDSHKRIYATAAVFPKTGKLVARMSKKFNQHEFIHFLKRLLSSTNKKIILFLDGFGAHKTPRVKQFLKKHPRLKLKPLPKYSPKLNPTEYLWGYTRKKRTNNLEFSSQRGLITTLNHWFKNIPTKTVKQVCSLNCILGIS